MKQVACCGLIAAALLVAPRPAAALVWPLVVAQRSPSAAAPAPSPQGWALRTGAEGRARLLLLQPDGSRKVLSEGFAWAGEPDLSPDARHLLFAGRRGPAGPRSLWQLDLQTGALERLPLGTADCGDPVYMSRNALDAPDFRQRLQWVAYSSDAGGEVDTHLRAPLRSLWAHSLEPGPEGSPVTWRITYDPNSALSPAMLADGRLLYASWAPGPLDEAPGADGRYFLMAMNWAGTGLNEVYGASESPRLKHQAREMPDRTLVFVESEGQWPDGSGDLAQIDWRRPQASHRRLSRDGARYLNPSPLPDGRLLVARAPAAGGYGLQIFDREAGAVAELVLDDPDWDEVEGLALAPRAEPQARIDTLWPGRFQTGALQCLNVYDSREPELQGLAPGTVRSVRVIEALPASASAAGTLPPYDPRAPFGAQAGLRTRVLGEIPVMPDGSFHLTLPADRAFSLQLLDERGLAIKTMRSFLWLRPWNRRGCVGCHAPADLAPPNRSTQALDSALIPELSDATAQPSPDFVHDVMPIVQARCGGACHGPKLRVGDLEKLGRPLLDAWALGPYNQAYRSLVPRYVRPGHARSSPLFDLLLGGGGRGPHAALLPSELRTLAAWVDLGALWDARTYDLAAPQDVAPGRSLGLGAGALGGADPGRAAAPRYAPAP